jgi:nitrite reductase (NO-forming)
MTSTRRRFSPLRDLPAVVWMVAVLAVVAAHQVVPAPRWLMIHLLLLGAVTHSILVWSQHFADALLHTAPRDGERRNQAVRLALLNAGVAVVVAGIVTGHWLVTAVGATAVALAVGWHGAALLAQMRRSLPARFGATVRYYVAAAALLPVGAFLGVLMARGLGDTWHMKVMVAHAAVNVLGWMGLTVVGTLVTLWPTMLRTRIAEGAEHAARLALPVLVGGVVVAAGGALAGSRPVAGLGLAAYVGGLVVMARPFVTEARGKAPAHYPTWSVLAGVSWLAGTVAVMAVAVGTAPSWMTAHERVQWLTPALAVGFGAQVLLGALSYLIPVVVGGGPTPIRAANTVLDRGGPLRIVVVNAGLLVCLLPVPSLVRVIASGLVVLALAAFLPLMFLGMRAARVAKAAPPAAPAVRRTGPAPVAAERPAGQVTGMAATGLAAVVLAVVVGIAVNPSALAGAPHPSSASGVTPTGQTTRVVVKAANMRFTPSTVKVPVGNRLVIDLRNTDDQDVHDLVLDSGADSGRLSPGESTQLAVGVVGRNIEGWCSVVGHRQMGMVFHVRVTGTPPGADHGTGAAAMPNMPGMTTGPGGPSAANDLDFLAKPGKDFTAHEAGLPPLAQARVHRRTFTVRELDQAVAPGVTQRLWVYNGSAPGPVLHGRIGDVFVITLKNDATMGHSIDFHAGSLAPDRPMRTIAPGQSLTYRFRATRAGIWLYHCSSMPMSAHIANGMFGAVVIDPPDLPKVSRSYVLVQSELYLGPQGGSVDMTKLLAEKPDAVVFNGYANQYDHRPLTARTGERIRIWVLDAGPDRATSFHVVGGQFDTVYSEGSYLLRPGSGGSQALALQPGQGGFVELSFPQAGRYSFVSHIMIDAERGAHGIFDVRGRSDRQPAPGTAP